MDQQQKIQEMLQEAGKRHVQELEDLQKKRQKEVDRIAAQTERINQHNNRLKERIVKRCTNILMEKRRCWRRSRVKMVREGKYTVTFNVLGTWIPHLDDRPVQGYSWQPVEYYTKAYVEGTIIRSISEVLPKATGVQVHMEEARNCLRGPKWPPGSEGEMDRECDTLGLLFCAGLPLITRGLGWLVDKGVPRTRVTVTFYMNF